MWKRVVLYVVIAVILNVARKVPNSIPIFGADPLGFYAEILGGTVGVGIWGEAIVYITKRRKRKE